jgi:hypothetical protein
VLIAPDLVITNNHVRSDSRNGGANPFDSAPSLVGVRFGHVTGSLASSKVYGLHKEWHVESSREEELDFCILRLAQPAGEHRIGDGTGAPLRGWVTPSECGLVPKQKLHILQHPFGEPLKLASGENCGPAGDWVDYSVNTEYGSSGSPVFDCRWQCVALHSRRGKGVNRGVSFQAILRSLSPQQRGLFKASAPVEAEGYATEAIAATEPGVPVDLSQFPPAQIQAIADALLQHVAGATAVGSPVCFELTVGGGRRLRCVGSDLARDVFHRQSLEGDLRLLQTRSEVLQDVQNILVMYPTSPDAPGNRMRVRHLTGEIRASDEVIRGRLEGMVDEFRLVRR